MGRATPPMWMKPLRTALSLAEANLKSATKETEVSLVTWKLCHSTGSCSMRT
jgi:hypothetical protein